MKAETIKQQFATNSRILHSSVMSRMIGRQDGGGFSFETPPLRTNGESIMITSFFADDEIDETLGFKMLWGRPLEERDRVEVFNTSDFHYLINEAAVHAVGLNPEDDPRMTIYGSDSQFGECVGVIKDFNYRSLHYEPQPIAVMNLRPNSHFDRKYIALRISPGPIDEVIEHLETVWARFEPQIELKYSFLDDEIESQYRAEQRLGTILRSFSGFALVVALLGLLGMTAYTTEQRRKEIGIRKVLGASVPGLIRRLMTDMTWPVLLSNLIAWPVAWIYLRDWLNDFPYRINLGILTFIGVGGVVLLVAWFVVLSMTWQAANSNPVTTLRDE
jgi:putative ABC transport system permease protein